MMNRSKTITLLKRWYPYQYRCEDENMFGRTHFNFDSYYTIGNGWNDIILELHKELQDSGYTDFVVTQIKEKFGILRVYLSYDHTDTTEIPSIIHRYERQSSYTCEHCGEVEPNNDSKKFYRDIKGWKKTLCDKCYSMETQSLDITTIDELKANIDKEILVGGYIDEDLYNKIIDMIDSYKYNNGE